MSQAQSNNTRVQKSVAIADSTLQIMRQHTINTERQNTQRPNYNALYSVITIQGFGSGREIKAF